MSTLSPDTTTPYYLDNAIARFIREADALRQTALLSTGPDRAVALSLADEVAQAARIAQQWADGPEGEGSLMNPTRNLIHDEQHRPAVRFSDTAEPHLPTVTTRLASLADAIDQHRDGALDTDVLCYRLVAFGLAYGGPMVHDLVAGYAEDQR